MTDRLRGNLIDGNPILDIGSVRFSRMRSGQERRATSGMIPWPIPMIPSAIQGQSGEDRETLSMLRERGHGLWQFKLWTFRRWCPRRYVDSVRNHHEKHPHRLIARPCA
jgi:hypothetical protein